MKKEAAPLLGDNAGVVVAAFDDISLSHDVPRAQFAETGLVSQRPKFAATSTKGRQAAAHGLFPWSVQKGRRNA